MDTTKDQTKDEQDHNTDNVLPQAADEETRRQRLARPRGRTFQKRGHERQK